MKIINHRLHGDDGKPYPFRPTPNMRGTVKHEYLIMHYTAGPSAEYSIKWLTSKQAKASAHLVIGRDGSVTQLVPFDTIAWHAGQSSWQDVEGLNNYSLGIEMDNAGYLTRASGGKWCAWFGDAYPDDQVIEVVHKHETIKRGWQLYTPEQLHLGLEVAQVLIEHYHLKDILGHEDIAPGRKTDPGPAFPLSNFRSRLFGRADNPDKPIYRTTVLVNIRSGPGTQYPTLNEGPLPKNARLQMLGEDGTWMQVDVLDEVRSVMDIQGWVHKRFVTKA
jgi:N-acetylmuramoyl-L-alanine amidase